MKKYIIGILAIFALLPFSRSIAQEGEIIYTDFEPDLSINGENYIIDDTIKVDIDQDGTPDFKMYIHAQYPTMVRYVYVTSSWDFRLCCNSIIWTRMIPFYHIRCGKMQVLLVNCCGSPITPIIWNSI